MRNALLLFFLLLNTIGFAQQANLYPIPNQSAQFIRMPSRNVSTDPDAVFFNPAALATNDNGFYFSINNQILNQITEVKSEYTFLNNSPAEYPGRVTGFIFPSIFVNYKINKASFHGGFFLVGGAGGVEYDNLPVSDRGIADIPAALGYAPGIGLVALDDQIQNDTGIDPMYRNITGYRFDFKNKGLGYSPAFQAGMSFEFNKYFSAGLDLRYVSQRFTSEGYIRDIEIQVNSNNAIVNGWQSPGDYLRALGTELGNTLYTVSGTVYDDLGADRYIDVIQKGNGLIPTASVFITPHEKVKIGLKYEPRTNVTLKTTVNNGEDGGEQGGRPVFIDGEKIRSDLPGFVSGGVSYDISKKLVIVAGGRYMFLKKAKFNGREQFIDGNYFEVEFATEYQLARKFAISGGYTYNKAGVSKDYLNDVDFWIPGHSLGLGGKIDFSDQVAFNFGALISFFKPQKYSYTQLFADGSSLAVAPPDYDPTYTMEYNKSAYIFAVGLDFTFKNDKDKTRFIDGEGVNTSSDTPYNFRGL